jgi:hypothetical protein
MEVRPYNGDSFSQNITCSMYFNLREAKRLRVFVDRVLRRIFGPDRN